MANERLNPSRWLATARRCLRPLLPRSSPQALKSYIRFWKSYRDYSRLQGQPPCVWSDLDIQINDWHSTTPISYYFYQDTWAFHKVAQTPPAFHVDIGSTALLVGCFAALAPTISVDVRPLAASVPNLGAISGLITQLPFKNNSVPSLSSLCVIEHIGLGRYGDPLDPMGSQRAAEELVRVLAPGGNLFISAPCGRDYIAFNAHRSFEEEHFVAMFPGLTLKEFVLVNNHGVVPQVEDCPGAGLHVGLFHLAK